MRYKLDVDLTSQGVCNKPCYKVDNPLVHLHCSYIVVAAWLILHDLFPGPKQATRAASPDPAAVRDS